MRNLPPSDSDTVLPKRAAGKMSSAKSVAAQAQARKISGSNVQSLVSSRVEHGIGAEDGQRTLTAVFPSHKGRAPHSLDLSFILNFPNLIQLFSEAFLQWGYLRTPASRSSMTACLSAGFFHYLLSCWSRELQPTDIDDELLTGFRKFVLTSNGRSGKPLHPRTSASYLSSLRTLLNAVVVGPLGPLAQNIANRMPPGPIGVARKSSPVEVIGVSDLLSIIEAAEREVISTRCRFDQANELVAAGNEILQAQNDPKELSPKDYGDLSVCLAVIDLTYPTVIPNLPLIRADNHALWAAVQYVHTHSAVTSHFYPSFRQLAPFVILLAIMTVFNPDTVLGLNWADISFDKEHAGSAAIEIVGSKNRASRDLVRLLDPNAAVTSKLSLMQLLETLQRITRRIRPRVDDVHSDRIFIAVQTQRIKKPRSFGDYNKDPCLAGDSVWTVSLQNFIKDNGLRNFALGQLRSTIIDLVQFSNGSLEAAQKVGDHRSPKTTWVHYTSSGVRKRYRERIGQVLVMRERWFESEGIIDPRRLEPGQDKAAATPGFTCLDPFDSPRFGQQVGKLCRDYGGCPSCPMAAAHPNDPVSVAYYTALEAALFRSQATMSSRTWLERWIPVLADLKALKKFVPPDVLEKSKKISITMMNVE